MSHKPHGNVQHVPGRGYGRCTAVWQPLVLEGQQGDQCSTGGADEVKAGHEVREMELIEPIAGD